MSEERWKWYQGYEGLYQVSTRGRVRGVDRWVIGRDGKKRFFKGRILKPCRDKDGYLEVNLYLDGKLRTFKIHRMVAETFKPNPENKPQVFHRDEDKTNCSVENLSWASAKETANWGTRTKRSAASRLNGSCSKPVEAIDPKTGEVVLEFPSTKEAGRNGFNQGAVSACCLGKHRIHSGLEWRFKEC